MRDIKVDFLRFLGFALIILAHVEPPAYVNSFRGFDVPMMVLISGVSFTLSMQKDSYLSYIFKRFKRLVLPTWTFLTFFFLICFFLQNRDLTSGKIIFTSFTLTSGIGYVWVIRVFFIVALLAPLIRLLSDKVESNTNYLWGILFIAIINEIFVQLLLPKDDSPGIGIFLNNFWDGTTYSIIFAVGLRFNRFSKNNFIAIGIVSSLIFVAYALFYFSQQHHLVNFLFFKYPPTFYFLSYGVIMSLICWFLADYIIKINAILPLILFLGRNTLWIYFWHIAYLNIIGKPTHHFIVDFLIIICSASATYYIQYVVVNQIVLPKIKSSAIQKNIRILFTG